MKTPGAKRGRGLWQALGCVFVLGGCSGMDYVRIVRVSCEAGRAQAEIVTSIDPEKEKAPLLGPVPVDSHKGFN